MADNSDEPETFFGEVVTPPVIGKDAPVTFGEVFGAVTPPGTDKDALLAALKAAQVTGGKLPGRTAPDISGPGSGVPDVVKAAFPALSPQDPLPADPFTPGEAADVALGEMYWGMIRGGIPKDSAERIIGHMLADMGPRGSDSDGRDRDA